jgi:hypothetical protein
VDVGDVVISPRAGELVLFPPWLVHGVPMAAAAEATDASIHQPRVSYAFNVTGGMGAYAWGDPWDVTRQSEKKQ